MSKGKIKDKDAHNVPPARSADGREKQLVKLAMDLAEEQLRKGTATSQVMTHFLKLATESETLSREKLKNENALLKAKVEALASTKKIETLYAQALTAMRIYSGDSSQLVDDDVDYDD